MHKHKLPTQFHKYAERLLKGGVYKSIPAWYPVMKAIPPGPSIIRSQLHFNEPSTTISSSNEFTATENRDSTTTNENNFIFKTSSYSQKHLRAKIPKPIKIRYEEDELRKRFYHDHPYELLIPRVLIENNNNDDISSEEEVYKSLFEAEKKHYKISGESVIKYQKFLMSTGKTKNEAYVEACNEFYKIRARQEVEERIAEEQAIVFGSKINKSEVEKTLKKEAKNLKNSNIIQILRRF
ncbi:15361_t:CDS:2 [Entrophospora sp. SA101]|nr:6976_t:CDS:2 [Entrophospora sp. SA101]CAJ0629105.1 11092_t:CDS:2 [Entrophospora sp. SA101]CAJ0755752.1 21385_t:CDS:2 [Entrophospora sp. SA101]CAJ0757330.1 15361_t:CDS:2 [Entrophospora sp. SA101]CAJ0834642.1 11832_t:CDS:2 [Entrophospora sp. SA101]